MKRVLHLILYFAIGSGLMLACSQLHAANADPVMDAGVSASAAAAPAPAEHPSDKLHDISNPIAAWDDARAAHKVGWPLAVFAVLVMFTKGLAYGKNKLSAVPLLGRLARWLSVGRRAMAVAAVGTFGSAGYDVMIGGGSVVAAMIAGGIAAAGLLSPTHEPKPATA